MPLKKDFDRWNSQKKNIHAQTGEAIFFEREIWLASLGHNVGVEIDGKGEQLLRPVLVYRKYNRNQCFIFPITTKGKENHFYHRLSKINFLKQESFITLSQARVIDRKRLFRKLGKISVGQFQSIKKSAQALLEPQSPRWL